MGMDFNDLSVDECTAALQHPMEAADILPPQADYPEVIPLDATLAEQSYPYAVFPEAVKQVIQALHGYSRQPLALLGNCALGAMSLAAQPYANVRRDAVLCSPISLHILTIAESGERKSAADRVFAKPLRGWQSEKLKELKPILREYEQKLKIYQDKEKRLRAMLQKNDDAEAERALLELRPPKAVKMAGMFIEDITIEGALKRFQNYLPTFALWSDEGGIILGGHSQRESADKKRMCGMINRLWDGASFETIRAQADCYHVQSIRLTVNLMVQSAILYDSLKDQTARNSGNIARFLVAYPESSQGTRLYQEPQALEGIEAYGQLLMDILNQPLPLNEDGELEPPELHLDAAAKQCWQDYHDEVEQAIGSEGTYACISDIASKSAEQVARIAGVFHVVESHSSHMEHQITLPTMQRSIILGRWYLNEALRVWGAPIGSGEPKARALWNYIQRNSIREICPKELLRYAPRKHGLRTQAGRDDALRVLEEHAYIIRSGDHYVVNPNAL